MEPLARSLILIVDDDEDHRGMTAECLWQYGFEVMEAENGIAAIDLAVQRKPDIILMDLEMPVMGGLEAIRRLKRDARTSAIPIVVLSANAFANRAQVERAGCTKCLVKPCSPTHLVGTVRAVLDL